MSDKNNVRLRTKLSTFLYYFIIFFMKLKQTLTEKIRAFLKRLFIGSYSCLYINSTIECITGQDVCHQVFG